MGKMEKQAMNDVFDLVEFWIKLSDGFELRRIVEEWTGEK